MDGADEEPVEGALLKLGMLEGDEEDFAETLGELEEVLGGELGEALDDGLGLALGLTLGEVFGVILGLALGEALERGYALSLGDALGLALGKSLNSTPDTFILRSFSFMSRLSSTPFSSSTDL